MYFYYSKNIDNATINPLRDNYLWNSNYLLSFFSLKGYLDWLNPYRGYIYQIFSFYPEDLICTLHSISLYIIKEWNQNQKASIQIFQRWYKIYDWKWLNNIINETYKYVFNMITWKFPNKVEIERIENVIWILKFNSKEQKSIQLDTRWPRKILYKIDNQKNLIRYLLNKCFFILLFAKAIINNKQFSTSEKSKIWNLIWWELERSCYQFIQKIYWKTSIIMFQEIISETVWNKNKEIDLAIKMWNVLYVIEIKSHNISFGFDKWDINERIEIIKKDLIITDDKVIFIYNNHNYLNKKILKDIKYIIPVLVKQTQLNYIRDLNPYLFLNKDYTIPRILTINELYQLANLDIQYMSKQKYCKHIS